MTVLEKLNSITLHDCMLQGITICFSNNEVEMRIKKQPDANEIILLFKGIKILSWGELFDYDDVEITDADFSLEGDMYKARIMVLLGFGKPSWEVCFTF